MKLDFRYIGRIATVASLCLAVAAVSAQTLPTPGAGKGPRVGARMGRIGALRGDKGSRALPWSLTLGKPDINPGHQVGFFIWHDANYVYVVTTDESDKGQIFSGNVVARGGVIANPAGLKDEKDDRFKQPKPNTLHFHFKTHEGLDGVKFQIGSGAKDVVFKLELQGHHTSHVFLGAKQIEPEGKFEQGRLIFDLSR